MAKKAGVMPVLSVVVSVRILEESVAGGRKQLAR